MKLCVNQTEKLAGFAKARSWNSTSLCRSIVVQFRNFESEFFLLLSLTCKNCELIWLNLKPESFN